MVTPEQPANESERIKALEEYAILDTLPEADFDDITLLASEICDTPISMITFVDTDRQWFKAHHGTKSTGSPREVAFCAHTINAPDDMMVVNDARVDPRFTDNPFVTDPTLRVVFYAGVPLTTSQGFALGTLCVIDQQPRELTATQKSSLKALGNMVVNLLELRKKNVALQKSQDNLLKINGELQQFAYVVSHDIRSPINNIIALSKMLRQDYGKNLDAPGIELITHLTSSSQKLKDFIEGILHYYRGDTLKINQKDSLILTDVLKNLTSMLDAKNEFQYQFPPDDVRVVVNKVVLDQILLNLISNAIKYNDKSKGVITVDFSETKNYYTFTVKDNGAGIESSDFDKIFNVFETLGKKDRYAHQGTGIGLSTVKKLVERSGGQLTLKSEPGKGSEFKFTIRK